jgi:hypothetical protein
LLQIESVCGEVDLFVAKSTYPRRFQLIGDEITLSRPEQAYLRQTEAIHGETSLSTGNQPYLAQIKLICGKINSSRRKQGDVATNSLPRGHGGVFGNLPKPRAPEPL